MNSVKISFLGDISFNDKYIELFKNGINPFEDVQPILQSSDYVIGNLECMTKGSQGENLLKKPRLTTTIETLDYLNFLNVNIVSLAHNHAYDHLEDGFVKTTSFLKENNILYIGASLDKTEAKKPLIIDKNGIRIGFLNYITRDTNPNLPIDATLFLNYFDEKIAMTEIKKLKSITDYVVLLLHWGGKVEGGLFPHWNQIKSAKNLVNAGCDIIIGHHSHTFQPIEKKKNTMIAYSLGNFCLTDVYYDNVVRKITEKSFSNSSILNISINKFEFKYSIIHIRNNNLFVNFNKHNISWQINNFLFKFIKNVKVLWGVYYFCFKWIRPIFSYCFNKEKSIGQKLKGLNIKKLKNFIKK
jgi:hypothetical protein